MKLETNARAKSQRPFPSPKDSQERDQRHAKAHAGIKETLASLEITTFMFGYFADINKHRLCILSADAKRLGWPKNVVEFDVPEDAFSFLVARHPDDATFRVAARTVSGEHPAVQDMECSVQKDTNGQSMFQVQIPSGTPRVMQDHDPEKILQQMFMGYNGSSSQIMRP